MIELTWLAIATAAFVCAIVTVIVIIEENKA
jgi:hypothetical protein